MANTTFSGPVRSENGFDLINKNSVGTQITDIGLEVIEKSLTVANGATTGTTTDTLPTNFIAVSAVVVVTTASSNAVNVADLGVTGDTTLCGDVEVCGDLIVDGLIVGNGGGEVTIGITLDDSLIVSGDLTVCGDTNMKGGLFVSGPVELCGPEDIGVTICNDLFIGGDMIIEGQLNAITGGLIACSRISDQKASGTEGGSVAVANTWFTRDLNTIEGTIAGNVSLNGSNQITLKPGNYSIRATVPAGDGIDGFTSRIQNITTATTLVQGTTTFVSAAQNVSFSYIDFFFEIGTGTGDQTFEVQMISQDSGANTGFLGLAGGFTGINEIYTTVYICRFNLSNGV